MLKPDVKPITKFDDFKIALQQKGDGYEIVATSHGATEREPLKLEFGLSEEAIGELVSRVERAVYGQGTNGQRTAELVNAPVPMGGEAADLLELGRDLYEAVFRGGIAKRYHNSAGRSEGLRIRISLNLADPVQRALSRLPWECLKEDRRVDLEFLSVHPKTPVVRDVEIGEPLDRLPVEGALRILLVTANPPGTQGLAVTDEKKFIEETFDALRREGLVELHELPNATWRELNEHLSERDYHVLHYMGHGDYDAQEGLGVLLLHGRDAGGKDVAEHVDSRTLALMLRGKSERMRLVFINACNTGIESKGAGAPFGGVATSILEAGIPAVVGMQFKIADTAAIAFAQTFYRRVAGGRPVDEAVNEARQDVLIEEGGLKRSTNFWITPVLYMRAGEDGVIFPRHDPAAAGAVAAPEPEVEREPEPSDPPPEVDATADYVLWFTEWNGKLVLNWRVNGKIGFGDKVALFDEPPADPEGWLGANWKFAPTPACSSCSVPPKP